ncbi:hypothetical protein NQ315_001455 [Exocentrus adspersus]|uniref:Germinal-center associated nuclear protein n=1 Tax=Exocentrus adspersus TaxID=1586481 RepID=A0AAV8W8D1_9CUCU|nr:hypothetical protein NQ315_001455 [Exocentrus adspersus]
MDSKKNVGPQETYKIICTNYPSDFILDKNLAKEYFRQFGKLRRLTFRPKQRICTVEYTTRDGYLNALNNSGEYKGAIFKVSSEKSPETKKRKAKSARPIWVEDDEVNAELAAMSGLASENYSFSEEVDTSGGLIEVKAKKIAKLKRSWPTSSPIKAKKKSKDREKVAPNVHAEILAKHVELISLIKSQATTLEEKYKVLDARDKLIRIKLQIKIQVKSSATVGTCPDMCPEKERLMRETKHQVALYEQEDGGRSMDQSKAIKQYSRSSADQEFPLPHELRPVFVLQMTMSYLMHNIIDMCETNEVNLAEWYHFMWDRTRGIRKDITQQELCGHGAVELIEQCARFHIHCSARLVAEDPSVFDQKINTENLTKCLQSLKYMYHDLQLKGERCPNEAEFRAYIILLNLNDGNFMWEVQELPLEIQKSKEVKFALEVYSALDKSNYVKFFKLVYSTTYLNACILMRYFVQVRVTALKTLLKCYTSRAFKAMYPLGELQQLLAFDDIESTMDFMQAYGLSINEEKTHILLEKNNFALPELPYALDRSLNVVELKRTCSVGKTVCGKELPPKTFVNHIPQNSFDHKGYLLLGDLLADTDFTDKEVSEDVPLTPTSNEEGLPVSTTVALNIFPQTNIAVQPPSGSIFTQGKQIKDSPLDIFSQPQAQNSVSVKAETRNIFGSTTSLQKVNVDVVPVKDETDWKPASFSFFGRPFQATDTGSDKPPSIFGGVPIAETSRDLPSTTLPCKKGGFHFDLPPKAAVEINPVPVLQSRQEQQFAPDQASSAKDESEKLQRQLEEKTTMTQEHTMTQEREEKRRELEMEKLEQKRIEEQKLKEVKRRKQEEALKRKMEELKKEEQRLKQIQIHRTVKSVLEALVDNVDKKLRIDRLQEIRQKIQNRSVLEVMRKWRQVVSRNKKKRKALDCTPVWMDTRTLDESAKELHTASQELTLKLRKRYKYGKSIDISPVVDSKISKINLFQLTYSALNQRFFNLRGIIQKHIFWKVEVSLPDHYELNDGLTSIEETLRDAFRWEDRDGTIMLMEKINPNPVQSVTYCIERQRGLFVRYGDANGIIFIAKDFNTLLQRRILENLKNLGVFTKIPIVIILQEYSEGQSKLQNLMDENIISNYIILMQSMTPSSLVELVKDGLVYLAGKVEKPPPLELDTLNSFMKKYLCTEIWKRAKSFGKWNSHYKSCLRKPNIIISLYNEALMKLKQIVLNKSCFEYPIFPETFKDYLPSDKPDYLPCNYCYFPKFWKDEAYVTQLECVLNKFTLPNWTDKWPTSSQVELEAIVLNYCRKVFMKPEKRFYKIMSVLLKDVKPNVNFEEVEKVLWTDVIEVIAWEKLNETNLSLVGTAFENKSVFNQFIVVYDYDTLENYSRSDWFYANHPVIKKYVEAEMKRKVYDDDPEQTDTTLQLNLSIDLDKIICDASRQLTNPPRVDSVKLKKELEEFNAMLSDLENSINIHRHISKRIEDNLKRAIDEN